MNEFLQKHRLFVFENRRRPSALRVIKYFNELVDFLNENVDKPNDCFSTLTIICDDLAGSQNLSVFNREHILKHKFFPLLNDTFQFLVNKLCLFGLTKTEEVSLDAISLFIKNLCLYKNKRLRGFYRDYNDDFNRKKNEEIQSFSYEKIFFDEFFTSKIEFLLNEDFRRKTEKCFEIKVRLVDRFVSLWIQTENFRFPSIINAIVDLLQSEKFVRIFRNIDLTLSQLTVEQTMFAYRFPKFIQLAGFRQHFQFTQQFCSSFIQNIRPVFQRQLKTVFQGTSRVPAIGWLVEFLNSFALKPHLRALFGGGHLGESIIDFMIAIVNREPLQQIAEKDPSSFNVHVFLLSYAAVLLYNLTFDKNLFLHIKGKFRFDIVKNLIKVDNHVLQYAVITLMTILEKEQIDENENNPQLIARGYVYMIDKSLDEVDQIFHGIHIEGVITNLEIHVEDDKVKVELLNEGALVSLTECVLREDLSDSKVRLPTFRIIEQLALTDNGPEKIHDIEALMDYCETVRSEPDSPKQRIADRIYWRVEREKQFIEQQTNKSKTTFRDEPQHVFEEKKAIYQYVRGDYRFQIDHGTQTIGHSDIHISFHLSDRGSAEELERRLKSVEKFKIHIDYEEIYSEQMATVVENSSIVIICLSNLYQNRPSTTVEALYLKQRHFNVIGVIVDRDFRPKQWMSKLLERSEVIDFSKDHFDTCYQKLLEAIHHMNERIRTK